VTIAAPPRPRRRAALILAVIVMVAAAALLTARCALGAVPPLPPLPAGAVERFGLHVIWDRTAEAAAAGVRSTRGAYYFKPEEEPRKREWIRLYQDAGIDPVMALIPNGPWRNRALAGLDVSRVPGGNDISGFPDDVDAYRADLRAFVERVDGDGIGDYSELRRPIRHFQIGNEVFWQWFGLPPAEAAGDFGALRAWREAHRAEVLASYAQFVRLTAETIRAEHPGAVIILGNIFEPHRAPTPLELTFLRRAAPHYDVIDKHFYGSPAQLEAELAQLRPVLASGKQIWSLEVGGPMEDSHQAHADAAVKLQLPMLAAGFERVYWSSLVPTQGWPLPFLRTALIDPPGRERPAYRTYRLLSTALQGATRVERVGRSTYLFRFVSGAPKAVSWRDHGEAPPDLRALFGQSRLRVTPLTGTGAPFTVPAGGFLVGADPVLLEAAG